jgi:hypothetical protein
VNSHCLISMGTSEHCVRIGSFDSSKTLSDVRWQVYKDEQDNSGSVLNHQVNDKATLVGAVDAIGCIRIYDIPTQKRLRYKLAHDCEVWCCCFQGDNMFYTTSDDCSFKAFDLRAPWQKPVWENTDHYCEGVTFVSPFP